MKNVRYFPALAELVESRISDKSCGHSHLHNEKVVGLAGRILLAECPTAPELLRRDVERLALCHDIFDWKVQACSREEFIATVGPLTGLEGPALNSFMDVCGRFGFGFIPANLVEACVKDADNLDAIGATGIGRAFAYGGANGIPVHGSTDDLIAYTSGKNALSTISHFHEKLLLLKDKMVTPTAKVWAEKRHKVMVDFLDQYRFELEEAGIS